MEKKEKTFLATIKERYCLNPGSDKQTYHLVIDLHNSGIEYSVGDCLGIYPENNPNKVEGVLKQWNASGQTPVEDRQGRIFPLSDFLKRHANLSRLPKETASLADFCKKLSPLLPRFYSIASSQQVVGQEAHLTVGLIDGVCSAYLCSRTSLKVPQVSVFLQKSKHFSLPSESDEKPIIMIGPGTGVAPFRGFIQERLSKSCSGQNWLFFGERTSRYDFYYKQDWEPLVFEGKLQLDCAFSRDQEHKVYVQHRMLEKSRLIWQWLNEGAYLFVCGDASHMAKDVDQTLHTIIAQEGNLSPTDAKTFIKSLKAQNRYQRDIY